MIVTEREIGEITVQIEDNIAININEEVSLALLGIDKSLHLISLVEVVRLH
jgi:hypothetical protein